MVADLILCQVNANPSEDLFVSESGDPSQGLPEIADFTCFHG